MKNYNKIDYYNLIYIISICHCIGKFPSYINITDFNNCNISIITNEIGDKFFQIITNGQSYIYSENELASFQTSLI